MKERDTAYMNVLMLGTRGESLRRDSPPIHVVPGASHSQMARGRFVLFAWEVPRFIWDRNAGGATTAVVYHLNQRGLINVGASDGAGLQY